MRRRLAVCKPREASGETKPSDILILDPQLRELGENKCLLWKPLICGGLSRQPGRLIHSYKSEVSLTPRKARGNLDSPRKMVPHKGEAI